MTQDTPSTQAPAVLWRYVVNGVHFGYSDQPPPDDAYDEGTLTRYVIEAAQAAALRAQVAQPVPDVDWLAQVIRRADGKHILGAAKLAEHIVAEWPAPPAPLQAEPVAVVPRIWRNALRKLAFMACTTGGASGRDEGLAEAISEANALLASPYRYIDASAMGVAQPIEQSEPAGAVHAVALVVEQLEDNEARVRWLFNPVPEGQELLWDHAAIGESATPTQPTPVAGNERETARMSIDQAREYLAGFMEANFTDRTFHRYIKGTRGESAGLAGDFAWQLATALRAALQSARSGQAGGGAGGEPVRRPWAVFDSQGFYRLERSEVEARAFCDTYNARHPDDPLRPYTCCAMDDVRSPAAVPASQVLSIATDALDEIALAGMSGTGQESDEAMCEWHARRAWEFIGIAARAKAAIDVALAANKGQS